MELYAPRYDHPWTYGPGFLFGKFSAFFQRLRNLRRSCRPVYRDPENFQNDLAFFSLAPPEVRCVMATAKAWKVTVNDLLLALLLKVIAPLTSSRRSTKRPDVSVGCIVNTRRDLGLAGQPIFGLFLGSFLVTHRLPHEIGLQTLATDISKVTRRLKAKRLYLGWPVELVVSRALLPFFSTPRRKKLYQKHYPLWGGITNMNLNTLWPDGKTGIDYLRAVSTGPATPLVFSVTTVGDVMNVTVTYRTTVFTKQEVERIQRSFRTEVAQLETEPQKPAGVQ